MSMQAIHESRESGARGHDNQQVRGLSYTHVDGFRSVMDSSASSHSLNKLCERSCFSQCVNYMMRGRKVLIRPRRQMQTQKEVNSLLPSLQSISKSSLHPLAFTLSLFSVVRPYTVPAPYLPNSA
jgi:hypothetical protein